VRLAARADFAYVDARNTPVRVWYLKSKRGAQQLATKLAAEIDSSRMWQKEQAVLGRIPCSDAALEENGGDGRLDIYLVKPGKSVGRTDSEGESGQITPGDDDYSTLGLTISASTEGGCPSTDFILLDDSLDWDDMRGTMAHELFHAFQDSFDYDGDNGAWWAEATATWAEDLVYPDMNGEQYQLEAGGWAKNNTALGPLDRWEDEGLAQYGAYIWPYYLTHRPGGDPKIIGQIYAALETRSPLEVFAAWPDWNARFKDFALWNWNKPPVDLYRDSGEHIDALVQSVHFLGNRGKVTLSPRSYPAQIQLAHTSMTYYQLRAVDDNVRQVTFNLDEITRQAGAGVQAIITIGDPAHPAYLYTEDWSALRSKTFCRTRATEQITGVVLSITNSRIGARDTLKGKITLTTTNAACP
jgi:hypothetical protein